MGYAVKLQSREPAGKGTLYYNITGIAAGSIPRTDVDITKSTKYKFYLGLYQAPFNNGLFFARNKQISNIGMLTAIDPSIIYSGWGAVYMAGTTDTAGNDLYYANVAGTIYAFFATSFDYEFHVGNNYRLQHDWNYCYIASSYCYPSFQYNGSAVSAAKRGSSYSDRGLADALVRNVTAGSLVTNTGYGGCLVFCCNNL